VDVIEWAIEMEERGSGELLITSMDKDGTWSGFDIGLIKIISDKVTIPVIANGGAGSIDHIEEAIQQTNLSAVAIGSMVVFQKKGMGVLVNFPEKKELLKIII